jgi:bifunctional non-homologous end joining protein LigD
VHEIKHDGYRLIVRRVGETLRPFPRRNYDWTDCYPGIAATAFKLRAKSFTLDGEVMVCGFDGIASTPRSSRQRRTLVGRRARLID